MTSTCQQREGDTRGGAGSRTGCNTPPHTHAHIPACYDAEAGNTTALALPACYDAEAGDTTALTLPACYDAEAGDTTALSLPACYDAEAGDTSALHTRKHAHCVSTYRLRLGSHLHKQAQQKQSRQG
jgi:hypothetical protein